MVPINTFIGNFGKYHMWLSVIIFLSKFFVAFHQMAIFFLAPPVQYTCPGNNNTCCDNPVYDKTDFSRTIVMEWNLICQKSWLKDFTQTIFQFGVLIGSLSLGLASDRYDFNNRSCVVKLVVALRPATFVCHLQYLFLFWGYGMVQ